MSTPTKVIILFLVLVLFTAPSLLYANAQSQSPNVDSFPSARKLLESKSTNTLPIKTHNQSSKNHTKLINNSSSTKNNSILPKIGLKKLNSSSKSTNSAIPTSFSAKKPSDPLKLTPPKNKTKTPNSSKQTHLEKPNKTQKTEKKQNQENPKKPTWIDEDFISEFRDLPTKFQKHIIPDLATISTTSKAYITKANKQMAMGFKPIVGNKYASTIASSISFAFIMIPLILVSLLFNQIQAYFSLQKLLKFIQLYLSIYFGILCLSTLATGVEPLEFFYSSSESTYVWLQVMQTLGYILYMVVLVMYLVLVFSTDCGLGSRLLGLAQIFVGYAVGLHYYVAVFHRMVRHRPPRTNWKIHGIYATCFVVICLLGGAERRKKAYVEEDGEEGKKS